MPIVRKFLFGLSSQIRDQAVVSKNRLTAIERSSSFFLMADIEHTSGRCDTAPAITPVCDNASTAQQLVSKSVVVALLMIVRHVFAQSALER